MQDEQRQIGDILSDEKTKLEQNILDLLRDFTNRTGVGVYQIRYSPIREVGFGSVPGQQTFHLSIVVGVE